MRRALVIYGDKEIGNAIASAIVPKSSEAVRRVAMWQHTPEEWQEMTVRAEYNYGQNRPMGKIHTVILLAWAMVWLAFEKLNDYVMEGR